MIEKFSKRTKALFASLFAALLVFSIVAPAEAATKPTASFASGSTTRYVSRGKTYKLRFYLRSNSYGYRYGYRSRFDCDMFKKSTGQYVDYTNYLRFSGSGYTNVKWTFGKSVYQRRTWYKMRYRTQYRTSAYSSRWYTARSRWLKFYVR